MTTVRLPRGKRVHVLDDADPTSTVCGLPALTPLVVVDAPASCRRCLVRHGK